MATLKVTFPPLNQAQAEVRFEVTGVAGTSCTQFSQGYERRLGVVTDMQPTDEMYEQNAHTSQDQEMANE